jgi:hypothetical protein
MTQILKTVALDTETYYDNEVSVKPLGAWKYSRHPRCDVYMISVSDGKDTWAGHPRDFNFESLKGKRIVSHNAAFDEEIYLGQLEKGLWPKIEYAEWHCTANMSAYLCNRRSLAEAAEHLLGASVSKDVRNWMKGKTWDDAVREGKSEALLQYARDDALLCYRLWDEHAHKWPDHERALSTLTIQQGREGIHIHEGRLMAAIELLQRVVLASTDLLPWVKTGRKPASPHGIAEACRAAGIPPMPVKAHDPDAAEQWEEENAHRAPWLKALKDIRKAKKTLATLETMKLRLRPDKTIAFSLKFFGAHSGRWAGDAGINFQNFAREPLFVGPDYSLIDDRAKLSVLTKEHEKNPDSTSLPCVDVRGLLLPPPGTMMAMVDQSQIEPRVLNCLVGNHTLLEKIRAGFPIYEAYAREAMGWTGGKLKDENKKLYALAKAMTLGLGYSAGWQKFISVAKTMAGLDITEDDMAVAKSVSIDGVIHTSDDGKPCAPFVWRSETRNGPMGEESSRVKEPVLGINSRAIVRDFREKNPLITGLWRSLQQALEGAVGGDLVIELPSGRKLTYEKVRKEIRKFIDPETKEPSSRVVFTAAVGGHRSVFYGGRLTENLVQAVARDVFAHNLLKVVGAGTKVLWTVHDEADCAIKSLEEGENARKLMASTPDWLEGCPVDAELVTADRFRK